MKYIIVLPQYPSVTAYSKKQTTISLISHVQCAI